MDLLTGRTQHHHVITSFDFNISKRKVKKYLYDQPRLLPLGTHYTRNYNEGAITSLHSKRNAHPLDHVKNFS